MIHMPLTYPVAVDAVLDRPLSRWLWLPSAASHEPGGTEVALTEPASPDEAARR
jgi:hypothetical protein